MRPAWMCLPPAILSAFLAVLVTPTAAHARSFKFGWDEFVTLKLTDGRMIAGRWRGALGSPDHPTDYADRYEAWRGPWGSYTAPALGDSLIITCRSGEVVVGAFRGFASRVLLLGTADSCAYLVVTLNQVETVRRAADPATDPEWTPARERWASAPALDAIALQSGAVTFAVPASMVAADGPNGYGPSRGGLVFIGVLAVCALAYVASAAATAAVLGNALHSLAGPGR